MIFDTIVSRSSIEKGWSGDQKYCVLTENGEKYLLRVSPRERLERRKGEFQRMQQVALLGVSICNPIEFGLCDDGVYCIQSWIDGADAEQVIPLMPPEKQYAYGLDAGHILIQMHSIPAPVDTPAWEPRFNAKIDRKIAMYEACPLKYEGGEAFMEYLAANRYLLQGRPQTYQHGDYHIGNMMISKEGVLTVIDFDKDDYGDPWEEFNRIVWSAQKAPYFASGMLDGYFGGNVPMEFWRLLVLYISSNVLGSLPWAVPYGQTEIAVMRQQAAQVLQWYENMNHIVPNWYMKP